MASIKPVANYSGEFSVIQTGDVIDITAGGTGLSVFTAGSYFYASTSSTMAQRTPAQVLTDIGAGTVSVVSVVTANGISGSVATSGTTPAITLTLGAITPTSVTASGALAGSNLSLSSSSTAITNGVVLANTASATSGYIWMGTAGNYEGYIKMAAHTPSGTADWDMAVVGGGINCKAFAAAPSFNSFVLGRGDAQMMTWTGTGGNFNGTLTIGQDYSSGTSNLDLVVGPSAGLFKVRNNSNVVYLQANSATSVISMPGGVTSTNSTTGTLVVTGGVGISGALNVGGPITADSSITLWKGGGALATNLAIGSNSLGSNTTGAYNVAIGFQALFANTTAFQQIAIGYSALGATTTGSNNIGIGTLALGANTTGSNNTAFGTSCLYNSNGSYNSAFGVTSLFATTTGVSNTALGYSALYGNTTGNNNVGVGNGAGSGITTGNYNTALGTATGTGITTGSGNTIIGANITGLSPTLTDNIILGSGSIIRAQFDGTKWIFPTPVTNNSTLTVDTSSSSITALVVKAALNQNSFQFQKPDGSNLLRAAWDSGNFHHYLGGALYYNMGGVGITFEGNGSNSPLAISGGAYLTMGTPINGTGSAAITIGDYAYASAVTPLVTQVINQTSTWAWNGTNGFTISSNIRQKLEQLSTTAGDAKFSMVNTAGTSFLSAALLTGVVTFTASPIVPTATLGDNTTKVASTAFVTAAVAASPSGTVTAVSVATANGVSGTSSGGATPALTISLGAITPTSVVASGSVTGSNLSGTHTGTSSGTNTGDQTTVTGNAGTATTLQTARTIAISGGVTGTATIFNGSANITIPITAMDASSLTTGTLPDLRLSGTYTGISLAVNNGFALWDSNGLSRAATHTCSYRNASAAATGAIVFYLPSNTLMLNVRIVGQVYSPGSTIDLTVKGYWNGASWAVYVAQTRGTLTPKVRLGKDASGNMCIILGDTTTAWSYPHLSMEFVQTSHAGANDASVTGWLSTLVTDLSAYTAIVGMPVQRDDHGGDVGSGPVLTVGTLVGGTGYTDGTYTNVALTNDALLGGLGANALATIVVAGGIVTTVTLTDNGVGYKVGDLMSASSATLGVGGSGFTIKAATVRAAHIDIKSATPRMRLANSATSTVTGTEIGSLLFGANDASANGSGDNARVVALAEGTSGGGYLQFWTSANGGQPTAAMEIRGDNSVHHFNAAGTFYNSFVTAPTANRTTTFPDANVTFVAGTMVPTTGTGATGTWGISITGSAATLTTARTINGVSFNGSANITINAVDATARLAASSVSAYGLTLIDDVDAATARTTLGLGTLSTQSGTFSGTSSGTNTGDQTITLTGNVTGSGTGSFATTIAAGVVTLAMQANVATNSLLGRSTAGTGVQEVITVGSGLTLSGGVLAAVGGGGGTVTSVSVTTANGVSGSVATNTTTPAITLTLGAITPTSVASTGTVTGTNLSGTNTGDQTTVTGNAGSATVLQTARTINGVSFNGSANITITAASAGALTAGNGLTGTAYDGSVAQTFAIGTPGTITSATTNAVTSTSHTHALTVTKTDVGLSAVENTALSTWAGSANITTLGTVATGTWNATVISIAKGGTGATTATAAFDALSPTTTLGDITYYSATSTRLAGNITATKKFLTQTGTGTVSAAPIWGTIANTDVSGLGTLSTQSGTFSGTHSGTSSGTNTGDQTITLTGDVTGSGTGSFAATISTAAVTLAKMANITTNSLIGRSTALTGVPEVITVGSGLSLSGGVLTATGGSGTVTAVSVTTANGVSGTSSGGATPALTITLGAITPTSVVASGSVTGSNLSGTNTGDQTTITGNAGSATTLQTARTINGVSFNGSANIIINAVDATARLAASAVSAYGLTLIDDADAITARATLGLGTLSTQSGTFSGTSSGTNTGDQTAITGNAGSATTLQTARTLTIGSTGKTFNGSANVSWTLAELGAYPSTGGTLSGVITQFITGASGTQSIIRYIGFNNSVVRASEVLEADGSYSIFGYNTSGTSATQGINIKTTVSGGVNNVSVPGSFQASGNVNSLGTNCGYFFDNRSGTARTYGWYATANLVRLNISSIGDVFTVSEGGVATATDFSATSDARLKNVTSTLTANERLIPKRYNWKEDGRGDFGFVAQDVEVHYPEAVNVGIGDMKSLNYGKLTAVLADQLNRAVDRIDELERRLAKAGLL